MKIIDKNTFGHSPAAIKLAEIVNEMGERSDKVSRILVHFNTIIKNLNGVDVTSAIYIMELAYKDHINKCDSLPTPLNTYTKSVLSTSYKLWQVRKNTKQPKKNRKS